MPFSSFRFQMTYYGGPYVIDQQPTFDEKYTNDKMQHHHYQQYPDPRHQDTIRPHDFRLPEHAVDVYSVPSVAHDGPRWSWCSTIFSIFCSCFCFTASCFHCIGLLFSILSYVDHKSSDYARSEYKRRCAWGCITTGVALGLLLIISFVLLFIVYLEDTAPVLCDWGLDYYCGLKCKNMSCFKL